MGTSGACCPPPLVRRRPLAPSTPHLIITSFLILALCLFSVAEGGDCDPPARCCQLQGCWNLYQNALETLGVRDDYHSPGGKRGHQQHPSPEELHVKCVSLRTFHLCIRNMTRNRGCLGDLSFHSAHKGVEKQMKQYNCSVIGPVFVPSQVPDRHGRHRSRPCSFRKAEGKPVVHRHCGLFGDPHLRTFSDVYQTCKVQGAWPLVENDYITVQVTNDPVGIWEGTATATSKLTVIIKRHVECASSHYMMYQAQTDMLPETFDDGSTHFGKAKSVQITTVEPNRHVEIYLRYIDTLLVIRQIGRYVTFAIRMPEEVVNATSADDPDRMQLCVKGCPQAELINYKHFLMKKHTRLKDGTNSEENLVEEAMTPDAALRLCRRVNVTDFYLDSCVFDLMTTGDLNFTLAAYQAQQDVLRLYPRAASMQQNRTGLEDGSWNSASPLRAAPSGSQWWSAPHRTLHYLFLTLFIMALTRGPSL